jgi:hydroxyacylglutathione hydrolase
VRAAVGTRAAWVVEPESEVVLAAATDAEAHRLGRLIEAVGFRRLAGVLAGGIEAWRDAGNPVGSTPAIDIPELAGRLRAGDVRLLDVRENDEWEEGHVEGSLHVPYHDLRDGVPAELRADGGRPLAVACSAGNRSSIAASLLRRAGLEDIVHVAEGGIAELEDEGIELVREG